MSEPNWPAIGLWSASVGLQFLTAFQESLVQWRQRRPPTGYERVIRGERINGWKNVIPRSTLQRYTGSGPCSYGFVSPIWSMNGGDLTDFSRYSQLLWFVQTSENVGDQIFHLNRFSLLTPNAHAWIMQVTLEKKWKPLAARHLTERLIIIVFENQDGSLFCLCMLDIVTRWYRLVKIESPMRGPIGYLTLLMINVSDSPKRRLDVQFVVWNWRSNGAMDWEFITASYEISKSVHDDSPIKPASWQSIAVPMGDRLRYTRNNATGFPPVIHMYQDETNVRSMAFRDGSWHVGSLQEWLESFRATEFGAKWLNVVESFGALSPPSWALSPIQPLKYAPCISGFTIDGALFCLTSRGGILERSLTPHSLKRLAAAAFCKAYPNFNFADLKEAIGFDVFDGIYDGKEPIVIHL